jgi:hypothetical protein
MKPLSPADIDILAYVKAEQAIAEVEEDPTK